ncbi:hypothetical protein E8E13_000012, partial [Curvularia kusanoi]
MFEPQPAFDPALSHAKSPISTHTKVVDQLDLELPIPRFNPAIHLNFQPPTKRYAFTELGLPSPNFIKEALTHPVTQAAVNFAFGADLQFRNGLNDVGYVNVQLGPKGLNGVYKLGETPSKPLPAGENISASEYDAVPIDAWHKDHTPVVLVL